MKSKICLAFASVFALLSNVACTTVTVVGAAGAPITRTHAEFRTYGEQVFRLQNAMLDELISAAENDTGLPVRDQPALQAAEDRIIHSCRDLNEAASLSAEGREPGLPLQLRVVEAMTECEASALAVKLLLDDGAALVSAATL